MGRQAPLALLLVSAPAGSDQKIEWIAFYSAISARGFVAYAVVYLRPPTASEKKDLETNIEWLDPKLRKALDLMQVLGYSYDEFPPGS